MKNFKIIIILFVALLTGCESFLEPTVDSLIIPSNMKDPELLLRGAYEQLRSDNSSWKVTTNRFINYGNDEVVINVLKNISGSDQELTTFGYTTSDTEIKNVWTFLYGGVNASNHAILAAKNVGNIPVEAEARFIRSFYYYNLATFFGGVPLITSYEDDPYTGRSSIEDILHFIEEDWIYAYENGPEISVMAGRTTRYTAAGYLAKLYLFMGGCIENNVDQFVSGTSDEDAKKLVSFSNWKDPRSPGDYYKLAEQYANVVYSSGKFKLIDNYRDNFRKSGEDEARANEWLFNIECSDILVDGTPEAINASSGFNMSNNAQLIPSYELFDMYLSGDTRLGNLAKKPSKSSPTETIGAYTHYLDIASDRSGEAQDYVYAKWRKDLASGLATRWITSGLALLRYSDIILMLAEAKYYDGNEPGARSLLSEVRLRASSNSSTKNDTIRDAMNTAYYNADFLQELLDERKRELCVEGLRRVDLIRTGTIITSINAMAEQDKTKLWEQGGLSV